MRYRQVGKTDLRLPEVGFGTGDNAGLLVLADGEQRRAAVKRALELGVTYFDTSPDYGKGRSEVHLGDALAELGQSATITTKVEIMPEHLGMIAEHVEESVLASLFRLGLPSVDIVEIHNPPAAQHHLSVRRWTPVTVADVLGPAGALEALKRLRDQGKVRYFGFACERAEPDPVKELLDTGEFHLINVWYNLLNPTAGVRAPAGLAASEDYGNIIDYAHQRGVGVAVIRPLAAGALTRQAQGSEGRHPLASSFHMSSSMDAYQEEVRKASAFNFLVRPDRSLAQAAYRFLLQHPGVTTIISGPSDLAQLEEVAAWSDSPPLTEPELEQIEAIWQANFAAPSQVVVG
ncbi:MAG TPA: aldo/keto reductase [Chloroflexota bacterium]|jgi:L-glyceraldehyde 3-phosphate reductase|nr:aldo/keto reductase [Chloroflexota bacterium]